MVITVDKDWEYHRGTHSQTRLRDITYRYKRDKLPFCYPKVYEGTQVRDESAIPLKRLAATVIVNANDTFAKINEQITIENNRAEAHRQTRESILNHTFKEYDHD